MSGGWTRHSYVGNRRLFYLGVETWWFGLGVEVHEKPFAFAAGGPMVRFCLGRWHYCWWPMGGPR